MSNLPGKGGTPFEITLSSTFFDGQILMPIMFEVKIVKVYKRTLWRRLLGSLGFKTKLFKLEKIEK